MVAASAGRWKMKPVTRLEIIFRCAIIEALKALRQRKGIKTNDDSLYFAGIFMSTKIETHFDPTKNVHYKVGTRSR